MKSTDPIGSYILGEPDSFRPRDEMGRPTDWGFGQKWNDHGRRRDFCRYCGGKHDWNECKNEGEVKPGKGLVGPWFQAETGERYFVTLQMEGK